MQNDFGVARLCAPVAGILTLEIWMNPKLGSDTNSGVAFVREGTHPTGISLMVFKNETDQWFYVDNGSVVAIKPVDSTDHSIKIIYDTSTREYDLHMDGVLVKAGAIWTVATIGPI